MTSASELGRQLRVGRTANDVEVALARVAWRRREPGRDLPVSLRPQAGEICAWAAALTEDQARKETRGLPAAAELIAVIWSEQNRLVTKRMAEPETAGEAGGVREQAAIEGAYAGRVMRVHRAALAAVDSAIEAGERPPAHPLEGWVRRWLDWRVTQERQIGEQAQRRTVLPGSLFEWAGLPHAILRRPRHDNAVAAVPGAVREGIPGLLVEDGRVRLERPAALVLADELGIGRLARGSGARLDKRSLVCALMAVPYAERTPGGRYTVRLRLQRWLEWLLGDVSNWRPSRHQPLLARAWNAVSLAGVLLPDGREWRPVMFRVMPDWRDRASFVEVDVAFPDSGPVAGPEINRRRLLEDGRISDAAFDGNLSLAVLWDGVKRRNGGYRVYAERPAVLRDQEGYLLAARRRADGSVEVNQRGEPVVVGRVLGDRRNPIRNGRGQLEWKEGRTPQRDWRHPQAVRIGMERHPHADKVPVLDRAERRQLVFGTAHDGARPSTRAMASRRADEKLREWEAQGRIAVEDCGREGWRILEVKA